LDQLFCNLQDLLIEFSACLERVALSDLASQTYAYQLLFKFLWKGVDKVTRLSAINEYENGGLKMIDFETMVKSLRLAWLKRIFGENDGGWKSYIRQILKQSGGLFLFRCNYDVKDIPIRSQFYTGGGLNSESNLMQKQIGKIQFGTIETFASITSPSFTKTFSNPALFT